MSGNKRKPSNDVGTDQDPTSRSKYRKAARTDSRVDPSTAMNTVAALQHAAPAGHSSMTPAGDPTACPNVDKENNMPATDTDKRPVRSCRGQGGHAAQLQKTAENIRPDLDPNTGFKKPSVPRHGIASFPSSTPENEMAPPAPQRQKKRLAAAPKPAKLVHKQPIRPDPPLQSAPVPILQMNIPGSQYGLQVQAPAMRTQSANSRFKIHSTPGLQALSDNPQPHNNYHQFNDFNVNGHRTAIHGANAQPQPQHLMGNKEFAEEEEAGGTDGDNDFYGNEANNLQPEEDLQGDEGMLTQANALFQQDTDLNGRPFFEDDPNIDPAKFYYKNGVGLVNIDVPADEEAPQGGDYAASPSSPAMNNELQDLPPDFDEASPSEDEANFMAALHPGTSTNPQQTAYEDDDDEDEGYDVLQVHRNRNRANRPPNPQQMHTFAERQSTNWAAHPIHNNRRVDNNADVGENMGTNLDNIEADLDCGIDDAGEEEGPDECDFTGNSRQLNPQSRLRSYPGDWRSILTCAKRNWQRFIILEQSDPFPEKDASAKEIRKIIHCIVSERRADGEDVSSRPITKAMEGIVFNEGSTFRGRLKTMAINVVEMHFHSVLKPDISNIPGQRDCERVIEDSIDSVLGGSVFHQNGKDVNGKTDNMAHPSIPALIHKFFYGGNESLAAAFPKDFSEKVPEHAIALALTAIKSVLEEWSVGVTSREPIAFTSERYRPAFYGMKFAINDIKQSTYHRQKYETNRARWAQEGMRNLRKDKEAVARDHAVKVVLD